MIRLRGEYKEKKYPKTLKAGHEYYVQLHVGEKYGDQEKGVRSKYKICQPVLRNSFRAGMNRKLFNLYVWPFHSFFIQNLMFFRLIFKNLTYSLHKKRDEDVSTKSVTTD